MVGKNPGVFFAVCPAFTGPLFCKKARLEAACIVSTLCSGHHLLRSQSRQSPGRFLWRGFKNSIRFAIGETLNVLKRYLQSTSGSTSERRYFRTFWYSINRDVSCMARVNSDSRLNSSGCWSATLSSGVGEARSWRVGELPSCSICTK